MQSRQYRKQWPATARLRLSSLRSPRWFCGSIKRPKWRHAILLHAKDSFAGLANARHLFSSRVTGLLRASPRPPYRGPCGAIYRLDHGNTCLLHLRKAMARPMCSVTAVRPGRDIVPEIANRRSWMLRRRGSAAMHGRGGFSRPRTITTPSLSRHHAVPRAMSPANEGRARRRRRLFSGDIAGRTRFLSPAAYAPPM